MLHGGLYVQESLPRDVSSKIQRNVAGVTYLVTVTPGEVAGADVLVGVLGTLLKRGHVRPVLPMLVPEVVGVHSRENESRGDGAVGRGVSGGFHCAWLCVPV